MSLESQSQGIDAGLVGKCRHAAGLSAAQAVHEWAGLIQEVESCQSRNGVIKLSVQGAATVLDCCVAAPRKDVLADEGGGVESRIAIEHVATRSATLQALELASMLLGTAIDASCLEYEEQHAAAPGNVEEVDVVPLDMPGCLATCCGFLRHELLPNPWSDASTDARAHSLLQRFAAVTERRAQFVRDLDISASALLLDAADKRLSGFLCTWCSRVMPRLKAGMAYRDPASAAAAITLPDGPDAFERSVAAAQMLGFVQSMQHPYLSEAVPYVLPALLAALQDPVPFVKRAGALTLTHLARHATATSLLWQRDILEATVVKCVRGCDAGVWDVVLPCAVQLAAALDGKGQGGGRDTTEAVAAAVLDEAQRGAYALPQRRTFVQHAPQLVALLGLRCVAHFSVLLPLLLEWLRTEDAENVCRICKVLRSICEVTWPRIAAHSYLIRDEVNRAVTRVKLRPEGDNDAARLLAVLESFTVVH